MAQSPNIILIFFATFVLTYVVHGIGWYISIRFARRTQGKRSEIEFGIHFTHLRFKPEGLVLNSVFFLAYVMIWPFIMAWIIDPGPPDPDGREALPKIDPNTNIIKLQANSLPLSQDQAA